MVKNKKQTTPKQEEETQSILQNFMFDMKDLGKDIQNRYLVKPVFNYGDLGVTNYLLWLMLSELMKLNNKLGEE